MANLKYLNFHLNVTLYIRWYKIRQTFWFDIYNIMQEKRYLIRMVNRNSINQLFLPHGHLQTSSKIPATSLLQLKALEFPHYLIWNGMRYSCFFEIHIKNNFTNKVLLRFNTYTFLQFLSPHQHQMGITIWENVFCLH